jgi:hypothetical protein
MLLQLIHLLTYVRDLTVDAKSTTAMSAASALAAWIALLIGVWNTHTARSALKLAREQDARRQPRLVPYLAQAYFLRTSDARIFTYSVSVANPAEIDNSLAHLELELSYTTPAGFPATVRLPHRPELVRHLPSHAGRIIGVAEGIKAHQAVAGLLLFECENDLLAGARIETFRLVLQDSHGITTELDLGISRELLHEEKVDQNTRLQAG